MKSLIDWLDHRTGVRKLTKEALYENIPGGARWRYAWGSALTFCLMIQFITGIFLWMHYSPSVASAWESVFYIQNEMTGGWLLRGIHHYTADVMIVLLVLHLMQVIIDGAYKAPREVNFWFGVILLALTLGIALTGYLLPWDQKGYWATNVATNIMGVTPFIGSELQKLVIGGVEYGHLTLTRFFALHAGILPVLIILLVVGHVYLFRRHGITPKQPLKRPDAAFWPDQLLRDAVIALAVMGAILFLVFKNSWFHDGQLGAELTAPADPGDEYKAARPEWYFLFLFQWLKLFTPKNISFIPEEHLEMVGAIIAPGIIMGLLCLLPLIGNLRIGKFRIGHWFSVVSLFLLICGVCFLTGWAKWEDTKGRNSAEVIKAKHAAEVEAERVKELAQGPDGIPAIGAVTLLREDPKTRGPKLFSANCASCHRYNRHDGMGNEVTDEQSAPDLAGFASREWLTGFLSADISTEKYFGGTKFAEGQMSDFVHEDLLNLDAQEEETLRNLIIGLSAQAKLPMQANLDERDLDIIADLEDHMDTFGCFDCHEFQIEDDTVDGPMLTGYGSRDWLITMISNPEHPKFYRSRNDRMPQFLEDEILTENEIGIVADWIRGDWYEPETVEVVTAAKE